MGKESESFFSNEVVTTKLKKSNTELKETLFVYQFFFKLVYGDCGQGFYLDGSP